MFVVGLCLCMEIVIDGFCLFVSGVGIPIGIRPQRGLVAIRQPLLPLGLQVIPQFWAGARWTLEVNLLVLCLLLLLVHVFSHFCFGCCSRLLVFRDIDI